jgi:hypothetical protein
MNTLPEDDQEDQEDQEDSGSTGGGIAMSKEEFSEIMRDAPASPKIGEGHAMAMLRLGGHELTQALAAFPDSNIRPMEEQGTIGNPTPQIVTQEMVGLKQILDAPPQNTPVVEMERGGRER